MSGPVMVTSADKDFGTAQAVILREHGGPEKLVVGEVALAQPAATELVVAHEAIGLNFVDTYYRSGLYAMPLPGILGMEAAGVVLAAGEDVREFKPGDRVAYATRPPGAYTTRRVIDQSLVVALPAAVSFEVAAAILLQGMTVQCLVERTHRLAAGEVILVQAAAGGVGLLLTQWAKAVGATVIGTVSSSEKREIALANGCDHAIVATREDVPAAVATITRGAGVDVVYDSVGRDTFERSLACLRPLGLMVSFGNTTGAVPPVDLLAACRGSLFLTRPSVFTYNGARPDLVASAARVFTALSQGWLRPVIGQRFALAEAADAHRALEDRRTVGSTVLIP